MHDLDQLDFDVNMVGCKGTWAAPLWMTPDSWGSDGPSSGEIDMMENCPKDQVRSNFAGDSADNQQVSWTDGSHDAVGTGDDFKSHTTLRKQADGDGVMSIFVRTCRQTEVGSDGSCPNDEGQAHQRDIYAKHGCSQGDCMYHMVSDLWNGNSGDEGWVGCTGSSTNIGSQCKFSVTNIKTKGVPFSGKCAAMTGGPTPAPPPPPPPPSVSCDAHPACQSAGLKGACCPTSDGVTLGCCGSPTPPAPPPPPPPPSPSCDAHPACKAAGLAGDCCPTSDGVTLGCCSSLVDAVGTFVV